MTGKWTVVVLAALGGLCGAGLSPTAVDSEVPGVPPGLHPVTNLRFWHVGMSSGSVRLGIAWPEGWSFADGRIDLLGLWPPTSEGWRRLAQVDVGAARSNAVVEIGSGALPPDASSGVLFRLAAERAADAAPPASAVGVATFARRAPRLAVSLARASDGGAMAVSAAGDGAADAEDVDTDGDGIPDVLETGRIRQTEAFEWHDTSGGPVTRGVRPPDWLTCHFGASAPFPLTNAPAVLCGVPLAGAMAFDSGSVFLASPERAHDWTYPEWPHAPDDDWCRSLCDLVVAPYWGGSFLPHGETNAFVRTAFVPGEGCFVAEFRNVRLNRRSDARLTYEVIVPCGTGRVVRVSYLSSGAALDGSDGATVGVQSRHAATNGFNTLVWDFAARGPLVPPATVEFLLGYGTDPQNPDTDGDGLSDGFEVSIGTDPCRPDTDGDGLADGEEVSRGTDPTSPDTDEDGLPDGWEAAHGLDPKSASGGDGADADPDGDGLTNRQELEAGTDPQNHDSDGDGLDDGAEVAHEADPLNPDTDGDGLTDGFEVSIGTDPCQPDTDGDGMDDGWEYRNGFDPTVDNATDDDPSNDAEADPDGDGLTNAEECAYGTNPREKDTDGDGVVDGLEVAQSSDPSDASDEGKPTSRVRVSFCFGDHSGSHSEKYRLTVTPAEGRGERPSSFCWLNANYGVCETRTAFLKPGWRYEVRLAHAGTKPGAETDYDYTLTQSGELPPNVVLVDGASLFGVDDTSTTFAGEGKVANLYALKFDFLTPAGDPVESAQSAGGIGQNEFTYDDRTSALSVLLQVEVQPTIPEALGLAGTFTLPAIQGATLTWSEDSPDGSATVRTDEGFDGVEHAILAARATYQGYPARNSGFGRKTATFACRGVAISQDFEVFFPKSGKNHPPCTTCPDCPNWFYYWRDGAVCGITPNCVYDDTAVYGYTLPGVDGLIRLGPRAAMVNSGPESYESSLDGFGVVIVTGNGKGIQCVAETIQHEAHHLDIYDRFHGQGEDPDGDGVPTSVEGTLDGMATHPNNPNTYNLREN